MRKKLVFALLLVASLFVGIGYNFESGAVDAEVLVAPKTAPSLEGGAQAKYVFLFIGDGMAVAQRNAAEVYMAATEFPGERPETVKLLMNTFPAQGMNTTYDLTSVIPDSASTGTALATGYKTASGVVGMNADGTESYKNFSEYAKEAGMKVGIISTVSIDHATPATFYSHQPTRGNYYEISMELASSDYDYFAGGPPRYPMGREKDQPSAIDTAVENGFTVVNTVADFEALTADNLPVWVLDADARDGNAMNYALDATDEMASVADYVEKGIELLDNEDGFFMMVEGGKIDWACHANDAAAAIHNTLAFEDALEVAYGFYEQHPDETLIIVTGDHETGGMAIGFAGTGYSTFFDKVAKQTMSYVAFNEEILAPYKAEHTAEDASLEDLYEDIELAFGLKFLPADERAALETAAEGGDEEAAATLEMVLSDLEISVLEEAFVESMMDEEVRSSNDYTYLLYGGYEPLTVKLTTIVNQRAGIAWTSYSHTGIPVQTSAIGVGAELFNGFYDQVDINTYIKQAAGF